MNNDWKHLSAVVAHKEDSSRTKSKENVKSSNGALRQGNIHAWFSRLGLILFELLNLRRSAIGAAEYGMSEASSTMYHRRRLYTRRQISRGRPNDCQPNDQKSCSASDKGEQNIGTLSHLVLLLFLSTLVVFCLTVSITYICCQCMRPSALSHNMLDDKIATEILDRWITKINQRVKKEWCHTDYLRACHCNK